MIEENCLSYLYAEYEACPGKYCARMLLNETLCQFSDCQKCPRGYRPQSVDSFSSLFGSSSSILNAPIINMNICRPCVDEPSLYDFMYLVFMFNVSTVLNLFFIDRAYTKVYRNFKAEKLDNKLKACNVFVLYALPVIENLAAMFASLLLFSKPMGSLKLNSCRVQDLSDWYSIFFDPYIDYFNKLHCSQEIVYPLYSLLMVYILLATVIMVLVRPVVSSVLLKKTIMTGIVSQSTFASLYFFPILIIVHLTAGGLIYYAFPLITIVFVLLANNLHFSRVFHNVGQPKENMYRFKYSPSLSTHSNPSATFLFFSSTGTFTCSGSYQSQGSLIFLTIYSTF